MMQFEDQIAKSNTSELHPKIVVHNIVNKFELRIHTKWHKMEIENGVVSSR